MSYRLRTEEIDLSGFTSQSNSQTGGIVIISSKGNRTPRLNRGEPQIIRRYGRPNPELHGVFDAIEYGRVAPVWISSVLGSGYKYAGVDVKTDRVDSFGDRAGRVFETFSSSSYSNVEKNVNFLAASGNTGLTASFSGTVNTPLPMLVDTVQIRVGGRVLELEINTSLNQISGDALDNPGQFNINTGEYNLNFEGQVGQVASYLSEVPFLSPIDLSSGGTNKFVDVEIDGVLYTNIDLGSASGTNQSDVVNALNARFGEALAVVEGNFIRVNGRLASANRGSIRITPPSSGSSAFALVFDAVNQQVSVRNAVSPTGFIPKAGEDVEINYNYSIDISGETSFSLFTESPFNDTLETYDIEVQRVGTTGRRYRARLFEVTANGRTERKVYNFSLDREKDGFGASIYYEDVFQDDDYLKIYVNQNYVGIAEPAVSTVRLLGGNRGATPTASDFLECWQFFQKRNVYKVKTFMDPYSINIGNQINVINDFQTQAFGINVIPFGNNALQARAYRQSLGIDFDNVALYTNWIKIKDPYNNSFAWISGVGKIGVKYSQMNDVFDGLAPAGPDENGRGGQLKGGFEIVDVENDYSEDELQLLDEAQINPIVKFDTDGSTIMGDKTLQVALSDTSFVPHRRLFNKVIDDVSSQILRKQLFKLNDPLHRLLAKTQTETYLAPILALSLFREVIVQCDEDNNTDEVLQVRNFILDLYVKVTPFSEFVLLRLTRLPQGAIIAEFIAGA